MEFPEVIDKIEEMFDIKLLDYQKDLLYKMITEDNNYYVYYPMRNGRMFLVNLIKELKKVMLEIEEVTKT